MLLFLGESVKPVDEIVDRVIEVLDGDVVVVVVTEVRVWVVEVVDEVEVLLLVDT